MSNRPDRHSAEGQARRDRTFFAETRIKQLRFENDGLRKQVFRTQETARIADEEALSLRQQLASMTQSRDAARARNVELKADLDLWRNEAETFHTQLHAAAAPNLFERMAERFPQLRLGRRSA